MPNGQARYRFAGFVLDVGERRLHADGRDVYLPPKTFETLHYLVARPGHLVPKAELLDAIWPGVAVTENALTRCIKEVRAALGDDVHAPRCIETVPRVGYRFIAAVDVVEGAKRTGCGCRSLRRCGRRSRGRGTGIWGGGGCARGGGEPGPRRRRSPACRPTRGARGPAGAVTRSRCSR